MKNDILLAQISHGRPASCPAARNLCNVHRTIRLNYRVAMSDTPIPASSRWRFQTAMILAVAADALQVFVLPLFAEGALSPADDLLDLGVAAVLVRLLGWH